MSLITRIITLLTIALLTGCASMSKEECLNANWRAIGYNDGAGGVHYQHLEKHRKSCGKYEIIPDDRAYRTGWDEGIRRYCTADNGFRAGRAGKAYSNICPADVEPAFIEGWHQGVREYCTADNALRLGLNGSSYSGVCPGRMASDFQLWYRLGRDVRSARSSHQSIERKISKHEAQLAATTDARVKANLYRQYEALLRDEQRAYTQQLALEACMNDDWYEAGFRDGESGQPKRAREITGYCGTYGIAADGRGYRQGWYEGVNRYCTYESGLHIGQSNQRYSGVCSGHAHQQFWRGYEEGRHIHRSGQYGHARPAREAAPARPAPARERGHARAELPDQRPQPSKEIHDNRDKLKHPMPEKSRKDVQENSGKRGDDNDDNGKQKRDGKDD